MRRKKRVLFDCDGVFTNFLDHCEPFLKVALRDEPMPPRNTVLYHDCFASLRKDQEELLWKQIDSSPGWVRDMPLIAGAREALQEVRNMGAEVVCLTSPHTGPHWVRERFALLQSLGFNKKTAIFTGGKYAIAGAIFIDDHPDHITAWAEEWPENKAILRVHPEYAPVPKELWAHQVSEWDVILKSIEEAIR